MGCHIFLLLLSSKPRSILPNPETHEKKKIQEQNEKKYCLWDDKDVKFRDSDSEENLRRSLYTQSLPGSEY